MALTVHFNRQRLRYKKVHSIVPITAFSVFSTGGDLKRIGLIEMVVTEMIHTIAFSKKSPCRNREPTQIMLFRSLSFECAIMIKAKKNKFAAISAVEQ